MRADVPMVLLYSVVPSLASLAPERQKTNKHYISTEMLGIKGLFLSTSAAHTDVGLGCLGFDFDLVRPRLHS